MGTITTNSQQRLDPVRRFPLPRRGATLRLVLAAVLLVTAAGAVYATADRPTGPPAAPATGTTDLSQLPVPPGLVGVPVSLGEPSAVTLVRPGDRVDLFRVPDAGGPAVRQADRALVLAADDAGAALLLALTPAQADAAVSVAPTDRFAVVVRN